MKGTYDKLQCKLEFQVGHWVWLRLHHRLAATLTDKAHDKLAPMYYVLANLHRPVASKSLS
jgi:hypothetical protein